METPMTGNTDQLGQPFHFADRLAATVTHLALPLVAGFGPRLAQLPQPLKPAADQISSESERTTTRLRGATWLNLRRVNSTAAPKRRGLGYARRNGTG
jgi:hypothetical protein